MIGTRIGTKMKSDDDRDNDRDKDGRGSDMPEGLGHEKLRVYQLALDYVTWSHPVLADIEQRRFLNIAHTCAMRAAACLDVQAARQQAELGQIAQGKRILARVVPLVLGLRGYLDDSDSEE